jgi:ubiquinone/menaquinone biosynthesis C-methylase UbiE
MDILGIGPGKNVADIGAGSGGFPVRAARRVTLTGLVSVDINSDAIHYIEERARRENIYNMRTILSRPDDLDVASGEYRCCPAVEDVA